jgi:hypothetical protein
MTPASADHRELIADLLGPDEPELSCDECFKKLDRYVELALDGEDAEQAVPGMLAHLIGCPACREDHTSLRELVGAESGSR